MIDLKKYRGMLDECYGTVVMSEKEFSDLLTAIEAAQKDAARLMFACEFDGYVGVEKDKYDYACECMDEAGRDEPNEEDELNGLRRLIDAKMDSKNSGDAT